MIKTIFKRLSLFVVIFVVSGLPGSYVGMQSSLFVGDLGVIITSQAFLMHVIVQRESPSDIPV